MLTNLFTSTKTPALSNGPMLAYVKSWDAFISVQNTEIDKIFLDGTMVRIATSRTFYQLVHGDQGRLFWAVVNPTTLELYYADEITGLWNYNLGSLLNQYTFAPSTNGPIGGDLLDISQKLMVRISGGRHDLLVYDLETGALVRTIASPLSGAHVADVSWAGPGLALAAQGPEYPNLSGKIALINYLSGEVLWQSKVATSSTRAIFNSTHGVIFTLGTLASGANSRIYSLTPLPEILATPAFYPAVPHTHPQEGRVVRTRLTGADGEPCPGRPITWELLGTRGALQRIQTETDADGYAVNYYFGPADPADLGTETLKVSAEV